MRRVLSGVLSAPRRLREPIVQSDLLLVAKSAAAATLAWVLAAQVFHLPQPFLAPWSALLTVHASVYRSLARGAQQVAATVLGVLLSFALAQLFGITALTLALTMLLALLLARVGVLRAEGITVATTALFVLTTGYSQQEQMLGDRILATALGIGVGVLTNFLVLPPLSDRSAAQHVDVIDRRLGRLLHDMAESVRQGVGKQAAGEWVEESRRLDSALDHAWEVVGFARESARLNPRGRAARRSHGGLSYEEVLYRLEDGISEARSIARTIRESTVAEHEWDSQFRERWLDLATAVGARVDLKDANVSSLLDEVDDLTRDLSHRDLPGLRWSMYGALLTSLRHIVTVVDDVASTRATREPGEP